MKKFSKILVYITDAKADSTMVEKAVEISEYNEGRITLLCVLDELPEDTISRLHDQFEIDLQRTVHDQIHLKLQKLIESHEQKNISISQKIVTGKEFVEIIREVIAGNYDMVMVAAVKDRATEGKLFSATHFHLLRKCPCPVWIYPAKRDRSFDRILVAVDTDTRIEEEKKLNVSLIDIALNLARNENAELHILHYWKGCDEYNFGEVLERFSAEEIDRYNEEARQEAWQTFEDFLAPYRSKINENSVHFLKGDPAQRLSNFANEKNMELLVMGTLGRSGVKGFFIGNTAESVLNKVNCSVLTVKPDGFVSPVIF